jgi:hypothetical protein
MLVSMEATRNEARLTEVRRDIAALFADRGENLNVTPHYVALVKLETILLNERRPVVV